MKTKRNFWAILIITEILLLGLSGCSGKKDASASAPDGQVKIVLFYPFQTATSTNEGIKAVRDMLEAKMANTVNVLLDWVIIPRDSYEEKKNTLLASGDQLDGIIGDLDDFGADNPKPGLIRPIDDLLAQYGQHIMDRIPEGAWVNVKNPEGKILGIPSYDRTYWNGAIIRQDWLDEAGLPMPQTVEEFENVLRVFKDRGDIIPVGGKPWFLEPTMASAISGGITAENGWETISPEGEFIQSYEHPNYIKFLEMYRRWIDNGWYDPDFLVTEETQYDQWIITGKLGVLFTDPRNIDRYETQLAQQDPKAKLAVMPVLSGPMGPSALLENDGAGRIVYITQMSKNPDKVVQYFDWMLSDKENYVLARYGIDGSHFVRDGEKGWRLPDSAGGDETKRGYDMIYMPLSYEFYNLSRTDVSPDIERIQNYYRGLPTYKNPLKGFIIDWAKVGDFNSIDIWTEIYNIAVGVRPLSDWAKVVEEYEASVQVPYAEIRRQFAEWQQKNAN